MWTAMLSVIFFTARAAYRTAEMAITTASVI